jgi:cytochrome c peroxidase
LSAPGEISRTLLSGLLAAVVLCAGCDQGKAPERVAGAVAASAPPPATVAPKMPAGGASRVDTSLQRWVRYPEPAKTLSPAAQLGKQLFFDAALSASGKLACASCHDPAHAYGPPNNLAVQLGGPDMRHQGRRAVPSLRYLDFTPKFTRHYYLPGPDDSEDEGPTGGFTDDGAVDTLHDQALIPLLDPAEMANRDAGAVAARLQRAGYAEAFRRTFGLDLQHDPKRVLQQTTYALEAFQVEDPSFRPYTSKFDAVMSGNAHFTAAELHGFALFNNPTKGNCAQCHVSSPGPGGRPAQFTDFGMIALGVPRNPAMSLNRDPHYADLGVCGPYRRDLTNETRLCGMFKTTTLRNVATRQVFFHNGRFHTLEDTLRFYVERDTNPGKWYPRIHGRLVKFDDLPVRYQDNIDTLDAPLNRKPGDVPALDAQEIRDVVAFLGTLNDGFSTVSGGAQRP